MSETKPEAREETTLDEVIHRIREGTFYEDYDWASGPALRALGGAVDVIEALKTCVKVIEQFKDEANLSEGVHAGLRKGTDAVDGHVLWAAISNSRTSAWSDAIAFALDPYFTMWGGDEALDAAARALQATGA